MIRNSLIPFVVLLLAVLSPENNSAAEPISLFDGKTLDGWVTLDGKPVTKGWEVVDGTIHLNRKAGRGGYIKSTQAFENFELEFEWRIAKGGNSGLKYLAKNSPSNRGKRYYGCEFQLLDDKNHGNGRNPLTSAGSLYGLYAPTNEKTLKPVGEFNHSKIVVNQGQIEHWLNGKKILEAKIGSDDWQKKIRKSKFNSVKDFADGPGAILLQDHNAEVWFKNLTIKPLSSK